MTPCEIDILFHYYISPADLPHRLAGSSFEENLARIGLLDLDKPQKLTNLGLAYLTAVMSVPVSRIEYVVDWPAKSQVSRIDAPVNQDSV